MCLREDGSAGHCWAEAPCWSQGAQLVSHGQGRSCGAAVLAGVKCEHARATLGSVGAVGSGDKLGTLNTGPRLPIVTGTTRPRRDKALEGMAQCPVPAVRQAISRARRHPVGQGRPYQMMPRRSQSTSRIRGARQRGAWGIKPQHTGTKFSFQPTEEDASVGRRLSRGVCVGTRRTLASPRV